MIRACALGEWLPEEAQAWWTARHGNVNAQAQASKVSAFGKTIAVSLDGRDLSASEESFEGAGVERSGPRASDPAMRRGA